jgi:hypothetical protein
MIRKPVAKHGVTGPRIAGPQDDPVSRNAVRIKGSVDQRREQADHQSATKTPKVGFADLQHKRESSAV